MKRKIEKQICVGLVCRIIMCGICGIFGLNQDQIWLRKKVGRMTIRLAHRGPDGEGIYVNENIAFGHRRLSIIDIAGGKQPMVDSRGYAITYNGEIYNFRQVRKELKTKGETFNTESDTEVLLKSFIVWGSNCLEKLNGMFAFAIADLNNKELFLARDRIGIKPLYYAIVPNGIVFASELPSLLASGIIKPDIDMTFFPYYLSHLYFPREFTPYKYIKRLLPGHALRLCKNRATHIHYYDIKEQIKASRTERTTSQDIEELKWLIEDAIQKQTISDVPIGTFLSGGIDSDIVTATLGEKFGSGINTFTVGFSDDKLYDESPIAQIVADRYSTNHHRIQVSSDDMLCYCDNLLSKFGQPFADSSMLPTFLLSKFASEHVKVVLSGDGGDEQLGGYDKYRRYLQIELLRRSLHGNGLKQIAGNTIRCLGNIIKPMQPRLCNKLLFYRGALAAESGYVYNEMNKYLNLQEIVNLAGDRLSPYLNNVACQDISRRDESLHLDGIMLHDIQNYMVDDVLQKVDMMSMAAGLEVRVPLLDHRVVEKAMTISWRDKVNRRQTKVILRKLFKSKLPADVVLGKKRGFSVPIDRWFRGPMREMSRDVLTGTTCRNRGIFNPLAVENIINEHESGKFEHGMKLWIMIVLEKWFQDVEGRY